MNDLNRRFDEHIRRNLRLEREAIQRRWEYLREIQRDTHDEWRILNRRNSSDR